tara:strand:- start:1067 stop:1729 length:663 start_codon:yes stop_codon:yes gene_type:complete
MQKNHKTKLVLFDLDGTLIDTAPDFLISLNNVLSNHSRENVTMEKIRPHISEGSSKLIKLFFEINEEHMSFEQYKNEFLNEYSSNLTKSSRLFDGMETIIEYLNDNGIMFGVVTNKYHEYAEPIINSFPELQTIKILVCPDHVSISKPDPEGILLACSKLKVSPKDAVYLGDHINDLKAGLAAGTDVIGCLYGYSLEEVDINNLKCKSVNSVSEITSNIN